MTKREYPNSKIIRVIDGDTFDVLLDHGCYLYSERIIRLSDVDAYESYGKRKSKKGIEAKKYCKKLLEGKYFTILSKEKKGKYGRLIADIILPNYGLLSLHLVSIGYAKVMK